jgi:hypothetical protein
LTFFNRWIRFLLYVRLNVTISFSGVTVPSRDGSTHHIRVFPLLPSTQPQPQNRSNTNYDEVMKLKMPSDDQQKGYLGPCAFRSLTYFDVGQSFLADSLHNLYGGVMVSFE